MFTGNLLYVIFDLVAKSGFTIDQQLCDLTFGTDISKIVFMSLNSDCINFPYSYSQDGKVE